MDCSRIVERINSLYQQGFVDDQFLQLQQLQDESNPEFMAEVVGLYFEDSERLLEELTKALARDPIDFKTADAYVHQFKGSSSSLGVGRVKNACVTFRSCCEANNVEGCWQALQQLKQEYAVVKNELEDLFEVHKEAIQADGFIPISEPFSLLIVQSGENL